jgi:hypothetical protein
MSWHKLPNEIQCMVVQMVIKSAFEEMLLRIEGYSYAQVEKLARKLIVGSHLTMPEMHDVALHAVDVLKDGHDYWSNFTPKRYHELKILSALEGVLLHSLPVDVFTPLP